MENKNMNKKKVIRIKYFLSGDMAQMTVNFELPPSDSRNKCVKQEPLYRLSSCFPD